jgi:hypothetical protein
MDPNSRGFVDFRDDAGHVVKRVTLLLSLVAAAVGTWVTAHGHAQQSVCSGGSAHLVSLSDSVACVRAQSHYMMGVVLMMGSLAVATLVVFALVKKARQSGWSKRMPTMPQREHHVVGSVAH